MNDLEDKFRFNYRLIVEYDGQAFHGWQKQHNQVTVQGELERVVHTILRSTETSGLQAAGRTDAGVHAKGQVVNFKTDIVIDPLIFKHSVSSLLKGKLAVLDVAQVPMDFNSLHSAVARQYVYRILNRPAPAVLDYGRVWHISAPLNRRVLHQESQKLVGKHDFTSFRASGCMSTSPIKEIFESEMVEEGDYLTYRVLGKGFLKQMVRNIVGTLVQISRETLQLSSIQDVMDSKDRQKAGVTAPAHGLYLEYVQYEGWRSSQRTDI